MGLYRSSYVKVFNIWQCLKEAFNKTENATNRTPNYNNCMHFGFVFNLDWKKALIYAAIVNAKNILCNYLIHAVHQ